MLFIHRNAGYAKIVEGRFIQRAKLEDFQREMKLLGILWLRRGEERGGGGEERREEPKSTKSNCQVSVCLKIAEPKKNLQRNG